MGPVPTHATSPAGCSLTHITLSRILTEADMASILKIGYLLRALPNSV